MNDSIIHLCSELRKKDVSLDDIKKIVLIYKTAEYYSTDYGNQLLRGIINDNIRLPIHYYNHNYEVDKDNYTDIINDTYTIMNELNLERDESPEPP